MDQNEFRALKQSGGTVSDADLQDATTEVIDDQCEEEVEEVEQEEVQEAPETTEIDEEEDVEQLTPKEQTAFQKRLEREQKKLEEKLRTEMEEQYEQKYSKHKQAIEHLGGDPDKILQAAKDAQMQREADRLAERNGWSEEETKYYIEQQKQQQELKELRVQMQINRLRDNPEYSGIANMEKDIVSRIDKSNGALSVEEAYWAIGGPKRAAQLVMEAQQREVARRAQPTRTVQTDAPSATTGEKPLPPSVLKEAERMGIPAEEARRLMNKPVAQTLEEYRKQKQAK